MEKDRTQSHFLRASFAAAAAVLLLTLLDQWTKLLAYARLQDGPFVLIQGVFEFRYLENHGMAFSLLQNQMLFFFIGTAVVFLAVLFFWFRLPGTGRFRWLRICLIFLFAGGLGNLIDRIRFRYVRDFLYFSLIDFPIFNVADIYVTCSAAALALLVLFYYKDDDFAFLSRKKEKTL